MRLPAALRAWLLLVGVCFSSALGAFELAHEAYVWQRLWTPELKSALRQNQQFVGFRVLVAERSAAGQWQTFAPDLAVLKGLAVEVMPVLRIDGSAPPQAMDELRGLIQNTLGNWQSAGIPVQRVELDFDCAVSRLGEYQTLLEGLRLAIPSSVALDITALPSWLRAPALPGLLHAVDRATLQVHAVRAPQRGLFDPRLAEFWIRSFAKLSARPFAAALPAYGARLLLDANNKVVGVEHEAGLEMASARELEIQSDPREVATLLQALQARPVAGLARVVWFRLPLPGDSRAWAPVTLRAVIQGTPLKARVARIAQPNESGGFDVVIANRGNLIAALPQRIAVAVPCTGEGISVYRYLNGVFILRTAGELKPGAQLVLGWLRCPPDILPFKPRN